MCWVLGGGCRVRGAECSASLKLRRVKSDENRVLNAKFIITRNQQPTEPLSFSPNLPPDFLI